LKLKTTLLTLLLIVFALNAINANIVKSITLSGFVSDASNGESLPGATVMIKELKIGTITNNYGFYSISLPKAEYTIVTAYLGYADKSQMANLQTDTTINIELFVNSHELSEVVVRDQVVNANITSTQMSVNKISSKTIQSIPAFMGEVDLIKALQLLPGVKFVAEGSSGLSVRGGSPDQNLILLDEATVYNAGHLMGFFSVFNNDAVKSVELFKGDLPARYGGRLASLIDVRMKDGNIKKFHGNGGIGLISSRLLLEGPVIKDKASFMVSGRRSYADLFLRLSSDENLRDNILYFYDLNAKMNYNIDNKNHIFLSGYTGKDVFKNGGFGMNWGNSTGTVRWNHIFHEKLFSNFTFVASKFNYNLGIPEGNESAFDWGSSLTDYNLKSDFNWYFNANNTITFGISALHHTFFPGSIEGFGEDSFITEYSLPNSYALESGIYLGNEQKIGSLIILKYGLRFSLFNNIGPGTSFEFDEKGNAIDSISYSQNDFFNTYSGFEPRLGIVFLLNEISSVKASYSKNLQYIQQAQNSTAGSPLHIWFPASPNVLPQTGHQFALGYFRNFKEGAIETSVEGYYKITNNAIDFRDHAELLLNKHFEGELLRGKGWSYGLEFMVKKTSGKLSGWASYTLSTTMRKIDGINFDDPYPAPYDRPHDISIVANYQLNKKISLGLTWVYSTGQPVTFPVGRFEYNNTIVPVYSNRNSYRMADYHRLDLSFTYIINNNPDTKWHSEFNVSLYNAYSRKNPYLINFQSSEENINVTYAEMTYLFGIVPSFTYNFKF
jgi:carboxypeptidase-like protein/TonB-dependent receptor-like protein